MFEQGLGPSITTCGPVADHKDLQKRNPKRRFEGFSGFFSKHVFKGRLDMEPSQAPDVDRF